MNRGFNDHLLWVSINPFAINVSMPRLVSCIIALGGWDGCSHRSAARVVKISPYQYRPAIFVIILGIVSPTSNERLLRAVCRIRRGEKNILAFLVKPQPGLENNANAFSPSGVV